MKQLVVIIYLISFSNFYSQEIKIPDFLDQSEIENFDCKCLEKEVQYSAEDQKYVDILWKESLQYLKAYAIALTTTTENCVDSDQAIYETVNGHKKMCIMDDKDMQLMVKHIYLILLNPDEAKKCFAVRKDLDWLYSPGGEIRKNSTVDQWLNRMTLEEFFRKKVTDSEVKQIGLSFANNFNKMITGDNIQLPTNFPFDISANSLPNLWAAVGWVPMYAEESKRNVKNPKKTRGRYVYGEIFGHWGLLRIEKINNQMVGAEVGMVVQGVDTFYAYHNHATSEMYYTIRKPTCVNQFKTFALGKDNNLVATVYEDKFTRRVQFDTGVSEEYRMWSTGAPNNQPLVYFPRNTIHAFEVDGDCEARPEENALVTIWARSNANHRENDYGHTCLCESAKNPGTPGKRGEIIQCDLTKIKW